MCVRASIILRFLLVSSVMVFIHVLASCASQSSDTTELRLWAMGAEGEYVQKLTPDFERRHPNIKLKIQMVPWTAAQEKLITAFASNNLPDVFQLGNTWIPQFAALNAIDSLNSYIRHSNQIKAQNYFAGIWDTNVLDGKIFGIPWYIDTRVLYYRRDVLKRAGFDLPPNTWDELYELAQRIKKRANSSEKYAIYLPTNEWASFVIFGLQAGSKLLKENDTRGDFQSAKFKKAFEYLIRFHHEKLAPIGISQVTNVYQAFADEYFVMYISGPWNINEFRKWMTGDLQDKWMTAALPGPDESTPGVSLAGGSSLVLNHKSKHKQAAWQFIEFLSEKETQIRFYRLLNDLPAIKEAWQDSSLKNDPFMNAFYKQFQHVVCTPKIPEWEQIAFSKIQQYAEFVSRNAMTVDEALAALNNDVDKILEKRRWLMGKDK